MEIGERVTVTRDGGHIDTGWVREVTDETVRIDSDRGPRVVFDRALYRFAPMKPRAATNPRPRRG